MSGPQLAMNADHASCKESSRQPGNSFHAAGRNVPPALAIAAADGAGADLVPRSVPAGGGLALVGGLFGAGAVGALGAETDGGGLGAGCFTSASAGGAFGAVVHALDIRITPKNKACSN